MQKSKRQEKILELVRDHDIGTQDALIQKLRENGYPVTQATISRDIKSLKLSRVVTGNGTYKYLPPAASPETGVSARINGALAESILHVAYACNDVVVKTMPGMANAVATAVDAMEDERIIGCIAGDDTILVIVTGEEAAAEISEKIRGFHSI